MAKLHYRKFILWPHESHSRALAKQVRRPMLTEIWNELSVVLRLFPPLYSR